MTSITEFSYTCSEVIKVLRDLIQKKGGSVYSVAKACGLPYTTVNELVLGKKDAALCSYRTVSALAEYFGLSTDDLVREISGNTARHTVEIDPTWEKAKKRRYRFPVRYPCGGCDMSGIHPLKQKDVRSVLQSIRGDENVASLTLFGSAPTICCNADSDLDFAVELREGAESREVRNAVSERIQEACRYTADIIWMDRVEPGSRLAENISRGIRLIGTEAKERE